MTTIEHLISLLGEEGAEIAQMTSKINRFGLLEVYDGDKNPDRLTNTQRLVGELNDFIAVVDLLVGMRIIPENWEDPLKKAEKAKKVAKYLAYARQVGTLDD